MSPSREVTSRDAGLSATQVRMRSSMALGLQLREEELAGAARLQTLDEAEL